MLNYLRSLYIPVHIKTPTLNNFNLDLWPPCVYYSSHTSRVIGPQNLFVFSCCCIDFIYHRSTIRYTLLKHSLFIEQNHLTLKLNCGKFKNGQKNRTLALVSNVNNTKLLNWEEIKKNETLWIYYRWYTYGINILWQ